MKKISLFITLAIISSVFVVWTAVSSVEAQKINTPTINCTGLPGCVDRNAANPLPASQWNAKGLTKWVVGFASKLITEILKYTPVVAVIALTLAGIMLMTSLGNEEREKTAKKWMWFALIGVVVSMSAYGIVKLLNSFNLL